MLLKSCLNVISLAYTHTWYDVYTTSGNLSLLRWTVTSTGSRLSFRDGTCTACVYLRNTINLQKFTAWPVVSLPLLKLIIITLTAANAVCVKKKKRDSMSNAVSIKICVNISNANVRDANVELTHSSAHHFSQRRLRDSSIHSLLYLKSPHMSRALASLCLVSEFELLACLQLRARFHLASYSFQREIRRLTALSHSILKSRTR